MEWTKEDLQADDCKYIALAAETAFQFLADKHNVNLRTVIEEIRANKEGKLALQFRKLFRSALEKKSEVLV
jgi:predicted DNA binding CopG/RHH family protein